MRKLLFVIAGATVMSGSASALNLYLKTTVDLGATGLDVFGGTSGNDAGFNPSALATDGTDAWIVGWNGTGASARVGMIRLLGAYSGSPTVQFVTNAAITSAPTLRGYQGVVYDPNSSTVIATYDPGSSSPQGLSGYGAFDGAIKYQSALRGSGNGSLDPGVGGNDFGYADVQFSSGRRWLYNAGTGANIYNGTNGFIFYPGVGSTLCRAIDFDFLGNAYVRAGNDMYKGTRSGGNSTSAQSLFVDLADAPFSAGTNVTVGDLGTGTQYAFFNDRAVTSSNQLLETVMKAVNANTGAPETLSFLDATGSGPASFSLGNGWYDIDNVANKLFVLDFLNRKIYVFEPTPDTPNFVPTGFEILEGTPFGGGIAELGASDDNKLFILNDENDLNASLRLDYSGLPTSPASLSFNIEAAATREDLSLFIEVLNQVTSVYSLRDTSTSTLADSTRNFSITSGAGDFVSPNGDMNVRLRWIPQQDLEAADGWAEAVDYALVTIP